MSSYTSSEQLSLVAFGLGISSLFLYDLIQKTGKLGCDLVTKGCLEWGGINMRFHLLTRRKAIPYMKSSVSLYRKLLNRNLTLFNPEMFEVVRRSEQFERRWDVAEFLCVRTGGDNT